jgi:hypothetical protein
MRERDVGWECRPMGLSSVRAILKAVNFFSPYGWIPPYLRPSAFGLPPLSLYPCIPQADRGEGRGGGALWGGLVRAVGVGGCNGPPREGRYPKHPLPPPGPSPAGRPPLG